MKPGVMKCILFVLHDDDQIFQEVQKYSSKRIE